MTPLKLHETCAAGPIRQVFAQIRATSSGFNTEFRFEGDIARVKIPEKRPPARKDELWKTTCCEAFWQDEGSNAYHEFNLSPSGEWAAYKFCDVRSGMCNAQVDTIAIACSQNDRELVLRASVATDLPIPAIAGLSAVIEDIDGGIQYWALAFPSGAPDFHSTVCRTIKVEQSK